jgi:SAM-dependent methyltransferase
MTPFYNRDLAYIQAAAFGKLAQSAAPEIIRRLESASVQIRRVVDGGCGAGPLTAALANAGFQVTGIDTSAELLSIARTAVSKAHFLHRSVYKVQIPSCEAIVALGETLTYHEEPASADSLVESFFRRASEFCPRAGCSCSMSLNSANPRWLGGIGMRARIGPRCLPEETLGKSPQSRLGIGGSGRHAGSAQS